MDIRNIHAHAEGLRRHQDIEVTVHKARVDLFPRACIQARMVVVDLTAGGPGKPLRHDLRVVAAGYKNDDGTTLARRCPVAPCRRYGFFDVRQTLRQRLVKVSPVVEHATYTARLNGNMRSQWIGERVRPCQERQW